MLTALSVVLPAFFVGGAVHAETLQQAVAKALNEHPSLEQALAVQRAAHEGVTEERSAYFPKVSASTAVGRVYGDNATSRGLSVTRGAGYSNLWEGSLGVNQMIFDGFKTQRMVGAAKAREDAAEFTLQDVRENLSLQTALAYLNVLRSRESLAMTQDYIKTLDEYTRRIQVMVNEGAADEAELRQAEEVKLEVQNLVASFTGQLKNADAAYAKLTGTLPEDMLYRPASISDRLPPNADEAIRSVWTSHPQVEKSNQEIIAAGYTADAQKSALFPTVTGELSAYAKDVDDLIGGEVEDNRALVRMNWELSTGGAELARIRKAKQEYIQSKHRKDEILLNMQSVIRTAYSDLETSAAQRAILAERLDVNQNLAKTYQTQFEGAKVRILQLLQVENQVLNARIDLLNADYRYLAAQYSVLGSIGRLQDHLLSATPAPATTAANAKP